MDDFSVGLLFLYLVLFVAWIAGGWKVFSKAGQPGWAFIIPIYNMIILVEIIEKPVWWVIMLLIPGLSLIFGILANIELAERFGKGAGFGLGLVFLPFIFYPVLGFGVAEFEGDAAMATA